MNGRWMVAAAAVWLGALLPACGAGGGGERAARVMPDDAALREVVLRRMLERCADRGEVYVSFGASWPDRVDPPAGLLERLTVRGGVLEPVSRMPGRRDPNAVLVLVPPPRFLSVSEARVSATRFRLGAGGADGFHATARRTASGWILVEPFDEWGT